MKRVVTALVSVVAMAILATPSFAQGRHDEKPHGSSKPSTAASESPASAGRHDEGATTHGKKKVDPSKGKEKTGAASTK